MCTAYRCPDCGATMVERTVATRIGDLDGWYCAKCDWFIESDRIQKEILKP